MSTSVSWNAALTELLEYGCAADIDGSATRGGDTAYSQISLGNLVSGVTLYGRSIIV